MHPLVHYRVIETCKLYFSLFGFDGRCELDVKTESKGASKRFNLGFAPRLMQVILLFAVFV